MEEEAHTAPPPPGLPDYFYSFFFPGSLSLSLCKGDPCSFASACNGEKGRRRRRRSEKKDRRRERAKRTKKKRSKKGGKGIEPLFPYFLFHSRSFPVSALCGESESEELAICSGHRNAASCVNAKNLPEKKRLGRMNVASRPQRTQRKRGTRRRPLLLPPRSKNEELLLAFLAPSVVSPPSFVSPIAKVFFTPGL